MMILISHINKLFFIVLICQMAVAHTAICQSGFQKIIPIENSLSLNIDDIIYNEDQLIIRGNSYIDSVNLWGLFIAGLDTNGIVLWHNTIFDSSRVSHIVTNTPSRFIKSKNNDLIIPSYYFNLGNIVLFITDSMGNEIYRNEYSHLGFTIYPIDALQVFNSIYIFGRVQRENYLSDNFVIKADSVGNMLWMKYYGTNSENENFGDVIDNNDGTMTISSSIYTRDYYSETSVQGWKKPWIFTIDTSGLIIDEWQGVLNDERTLGGRPFYHMANGNWVMVSSELKEFQVSEFITEVHTSPTLTKLDSNFNLLWKLNLTDYTDRFDKIIDLEYDSIRDEFVVAGNLSVWYGLTNSASEAWIVKVNSEGDIVWNITDTVLYHQYELHYTAGLALAPSGSIYVAGYVDHSRNDGWIIKVTPDGCSDTLCTITSIQEQILNKEKKVLVFPNPVDDQINIIIKEYNGRAGILIYDVFGRLVLKEELYQEKNIIPIDFTTGIYFYSVLLNHKILASGKLMVK